MPNHVVNELIFEGLTPPQCDKVLGLVINESKQVDFALLLPVPLNCWMGSVGTNHQKAFPDNALDWCSKNWSTKWNAYGQHFTEYDGARLTIRFKTAWRAPYGWMCALWNASKLGFSYGYLSEGESKAHVGKFAMTPNSPWTNEEWSERDAGNAERNRLGELLWGAEAWQEINQDNDALKG